ncbi:nesprin-2-like [Pelmatolapia mariae]|uniref:nesprin-2-like n=1 Tax=Pelmatolapia mariae TaxID=158779 RepID=UPI002FE5777E
MRRKRSSRSIFRDLYDVIERLRREAGHQLFQGTLQAWLLASARECGHRWDDVNAKPESITARLQLLVSEWEGFEAQREELVVWLADVDFHPSEVDQLTGNTCEKLKQLQVWACFDMTYI